MTPNIYAEDMARQPLFDPDPATTTVTQLVKMTHRKQNRISDLLVGALKMGVKTKRVKVKEADIFQTVFVIGVNLRKIRKHQGRPLLAPDGSAMSIDGVAYGGGDCIPADIYNIDDVDAAPVHPNFDKWLKELLDTEDPTISAFEYALQAAFNAEATVEAAVKPEASEAALEDAGENPFPATPAAFPSAEDNFSSPVRSAESAPCIPDNYHSKGHASTTAGRNYVTLKSGIQISPWTWLAITGALSVFLLFSIWLYFMITVQFFASCVCP